MLNAIETSFTVDWIGATFTREGADSFIRSMYDGISTFKPASVQTRGYNQAFENEDGIRYNTHTEREEMGVHIAMSGSCLRKLYAKFMDWKQLFELIDKNNGRTSRVDLAFDVKNSGLTPTDLGKPTLRPYKGKGRTPKFNTLLGGDGSWTLYIGSRSSEKMLRIYDKAKEQKDYVSDYIRVEVETKGETGRAVGWNFARSDKNECVAMAIGLAKGVADFNLPAWDYALRGERVGLAIPQGKEKDTFGWLVKVCAPALAKEIEKRPSDDVLMAFWDALRVELGKRGIEVTGSEQ